MNNRKALMIIDVQVALFQHKIPLHKSDQVLKNIQILIGKAKASKTPILYIQHTEDEGLFSRNCSTWQIHPGITPDQNHYVIEKTSWDAFYLTALKERLTSLNVNHLIIAGMQTEFCLDTTIRNGFSHGYQLSVCGDAHSTFDNDLLKAHQIIAHHNSIWHNRFAQVINTDTVSF